MICKIRYFTLTPGKKKGDKMVNENVQKITQCHNSQFHYYLQKKFTRKPKWPSEVERYSSICR
jgi:hypothetical protein